MKQKSYKNPFEVIYDDADVAFVAHLKSQLTILIVKKIRESSLTQKDVALRLGVSQPRISNLMNGRLDKFSFDMLIIFARKLGFPVANSFNPYGEELLTLVVKDNG